MSNSHFQLELLLFPSVVIRSSVAQIFLKSAYVTYILMKTFVVNQWSLSGRNWFLVHLMVKYGVGMNSGCSKSAWNLATKVHSRKSRPRTRTRLLSHIFFCRSIFNDRYIHRMYIGAGISCRLNNSFF